MRIYLNGRLLVHSKVFENVGKERIERNFKGERDWNVYTWNSKNKLTSEEDGTSKSDYNIIEASLVKYKPLKLKAKPEEIYDEFINSGIAPPDHYIHISAYRSFILTSQKTMMKIIEELEKENINCLLNNCNAPAISHKFYTSPELQKQLANPIEVKL